MPDSLPDRARRGPDFLNRDHRFRLSWSCVHPAPRRAWWPACWSATTGTFALQTNPWWMSVGPATDFMESDGRTSRLRCPPTTPAKCSAKHRWKPIAALVRAHARVLVAKLWPHGLKFRIVWPGCGGGWLQRWADRPLPLCD